MANSKYEYVKSFENEDEMMYPNLIVVRIDGCNFERFSEINEFEKPNDERALNLMNCCATSVLEKYPDIILAYGFSDEYSFIFKKETKFYQRRVSKILSLVVSFFASLYVAKWREFFPAKDMRSTPSFKSRVICCPSMEVLQAYLAWRQRECHSKNQYNTCLWMLIKSGKSEREAHEVLKGTQKQEKNEILFQQFGINYKKLPSMYRQGSCVLKTEVDDTLKIPDNEAPVKRLRKKVIIVHSENIASRSFWNDYSCLCKEIGGFEQNVNNIKQEYVKSFQSENKLLPFTWIVIRIDGSHFHRFSEVQGFEKPNDEHALKLMNSCAVAVLEEFNDIVFAYGVSDEYSFVLKRNTQLYQRRASEIVSATVSFFSSTYVMKWKEFFPKKELKYPPNFDGRAVCYPSYEIIRDYLAWRQVDCHINNQYNTCFWMLVKSGKSTREAQSLLKGTQTQEKNQMLSQLFGIDYNMLPVIFRNGSSVFWDKSLDQTEICSTCDLMAASDGEYKLFRQVGRDRLLYEMLKASASSKGSWKVFIMDKVTVKVMAASCKMSDITDQGVSLVEQLFKRREPMPGMDVVYFVQPIYENLIMFISDMSGREPLYKKAFVFFSSSIPKDFVGRIKGDTSVVPRVGALREMNLEYFPIDNQAFLTDHGGALEELYSEDAENSRDFNICLKSMATRLATVFASLKELPVVRYRVKDVDVKDVDGSTGTTFRDSIPKKLALAVWEYISSYKTTIPNYPQIETCELLIVDRSVDLVAPIIHEWTYDAMCHDLVDLDGNKYVMEVPSKSGGPPERKTFLLEDHDPVWVEMRYLHIADASERLSDKMDNLLSKNKAAQLQNKDSSELSTRDIQKMVQDLPAYNEQMEKLSLHAEIAGKINTVISEEGLRDLGQIEQDIVFGDAGHKELIEYLSENEDGNVENMLRLMMIYALADPEKFEGENGAKLMELANLSHDDMRMIDNMRLLEGPVKKKKQETKGGFLNFDKKKANNALRKDKQGEEETWALFRFFPVLEELIEKIDKHELPKDEYKCINDPSTRGVSGHAAGRAAAQQSRRSRRTPAPGKASDDGHSSDSALKNAANDLKHMGQRIFIFIIGGATRSELRICHKLTSKLRREVVLGSTSIDDPPMYLTKLKMLTMKEGM